MKKVGKISTGIMGLLLSLGMAVNPVAALTRFEYADWDTADKYYGTKEAVSDVVTKLTGASHDDGFVGQVVGAYTKASEGALLKDGITEEVYIELDPEKYQVNDLFEVTVSLDESEATKQNGQLTEKGVMTQMTDENTFTITSNGWYNKTIATVKESGVYTYRWHYYAKEDKGYVEFSILLGDKVIGTTGEQEVAEINANNKDTVSVRSVWFCNIKTHDGVYVHSRLPETTVDVEEDSKVAIVDEDISDVLKESLVGTDEYEELKDLVDFNVKLESSEATVTEDDKASFEEVAGNGKVAEYFDLNVVVTAGETEYNLHELTKPITLTVAIPESVPAVEEGYTRTYYVLREHNGVVEKLKTTLSEDGKSLSFATDKFSTYALAYEDAAVVPEVDNPLTADAIMMYAAMGVVSLGVIALGVKSLRKEN